MEKKKKHFGRPKILIDWIKVDNLLQAQCNGVGIASLCGVCADTLYRECAKVHKMTFSDYSARKKAEGIEMLRSVQFQAALGGNVIMQIWLGKQYAGQRDRQDIAHEGIPPSVTINVASPENAKKLKDFLNGESK